MSIISTILFSVLFFSASKGADSSQTNGPVFQAQIGYGLAAHISSFNYVGFFDSSSDYFLMFGLQTPNGWELHGVCDFLHYYNDYAYTRLKLADDPDPGPWGYIGSLGTVISNELSLGVEGGHAIRFSWGEGSWYLGIKATYGWLQATDTLGKYWIENDKTPYPVYVVAPVMGGQCRLGMSIPVATIGCFSLRIHPFINAGKLLTGKIIKISPNTKWAKQYTPGTYTMPRSGVGLNLSLNYKGGKQ